MTRNVHLYLFVSIIHAYINQVDTETLTFRWYILIVGGILYSKLESNQFLIPLPRVILTLWGQFLGRINGVPEKIYYKKCSFYGI